jgi:hypothetical protein
MTVEKHYVSVVLVHNYGANHHSTSFFSRASLDSFPPKRHSVIVNSCTPDPSISARPR